MPAPIGKEFGRVFEEQNLGIPLDDSLRSMTDRIPNLDLKFFVTAVDPAAADGRRPGRNPRQDRRPDPRPLPDLGPGAGPDRRRPPVGRRAAGACRSCLFVAVYRLNPDYVMVLFTDPMGKKMLAGAVVMQVLGALVIRKIVNIKV